jgi:hypothetical protein
MFDQQKGETWSIPLPPYFQAAAGKDAAAP